MWIKNIEKSNKPYHIQPILYNDIQTYIEQAILYDFNMIIEDFTFYQELTPKMQTDLIRSIKAFKDFEKNFSHFFDDCERGFTNEVIISLSCRISPPDKTIIGYKSVVKDLYFIREGMVQVHNNPDDELDNKRNQPIFYLPKYSYFGDYHIFYNLRANLIFSTLKYDEEIQYKSCNPQAETIFMCISKETLLYLCNLFPQTAENIQRKSLERRAAFMKHRTLNSKQFLSQ